MVFPLPPLGSLRIIEDPNMVESWLDWSGVRSRARAERRRRRGFPQRVVIRQRPIQTAYRVGNMLVMHPEVARQLRARIERGG